MDEKQKSADSEAEKKEKNHKLKKTHLYGEDFFPVSPVTPSRLITLYEYTDGSGYVIEVTARTYHFSKEAALKTAENLKKTISPIQ